MPGRRFSACCPPLLLPPFLSCLSGCGGGAGGGSGGGGGADGGGVDGGLVGVSSLRLLCSLIKRGWKSVSPSCIVGFCRIYPPITENKHRMVSVPLFPGSSSTHTSFIGWCDRNLREKRSHFEREHYRISIWHSGQVLPGQDWKKNIEEHLQEVATNTPILLHFRFCLCYTCRGANLPISNRSS